jgi:hypothetical protein
MEEGTMTRGTLQRRSLPTALVLGLALLALASCGSEAATPQASRGEPGGQQPRQIEVANSLPGLATAGGAARAGVNTLGNTTTGIWVTGRGEATAVPDLATLSFGVEAFAGTVGEASAAAAAATAQMLSVLRSKKVAERDVQTRSFNINARYTTREVTRCVGPEEPVTPKATPTPPPRGSGPATLSPVPAAVAGSLGAPGDCVVHHEQVIVGFEVTNQLTARVRDLAAVGGIIDDVAEAGGDLTRFQGVGFSIEDTRASQDQARAAAVADLLTKANHIASLAGLKLAAPFFITESGGLSPFAASERAAFASALAVPTPILGGEIEVVVTLQAAFDIASTSP